MKLPKVTFIGGLLLVVVHLFSPLVQGLILDNMGEQLMVNVMFGVMGAAALMSVWGTVFKGHRDLLTTVFVGATLFFILVSRPMFAIRLSFFLFFLLGVVSGMEERLAGKWLPLLVIGLFAVGAEALPSFFYSGLEFYGLDAWTLFLGGLSGRLLLCSGR